MYPWGGSKLVTSSSGLDFHAKFWSQFFLPVHMHSLTRCTTSTLLPAWLTCIKYSPLSTVLNGGHMIGHTIPACVLTSDRAMLLLVYFTLLTMAII